MCDITTFTLLKALHILLHIIFNVFFLFPQVWCVLVQSEPSCDQTEFLHTNGTCVSCPVCGPGEQLSEVTHSTHYCTTSLPFTFLLLPVFLLGSRTVVLEMEAKASVSCVVKGSSALTQASLPACAAHSAIC